jgi:hypothetical protein
MIRTISQLFLNWRWVDKVQLVHSVAFICFGFLILVRLGGHGTLLGYLVGGSFLFFGLYRFRYFVQSFNRIYLETRKNTSRH